MYNCTHERTNKISCILYLGTQQSLHVKESQMDIKNQTTFQKLCTLCVTTDNWYYMAFFTYSVSSCRLRLEVGLPHILKYRYNTIHMYSGITSGSVLDGELL